jgi:uncharacterized protein YndB with AHSA1/START domain
MSKAEHSVTIHRPPDAVFALIADGEQCPRWRTGVLEIKRRTGGGGVGTVYAQTVSGPMGRKVAADYEVTASEANRRYEFETIAGPVRPHGRYLLEEADGGTRLSFRLDVILGGIGGLLMGGTVRRTMETEVQAIERLRELLEAEPAQEAPATD